MLDFEHRYSGVGRNPVKQRVARGDTFYNLSMTFFRRCILDRR